MRPESKRLILNLLGNQIVWFIAVIAAGRGLAWPGVLAAAVFVCLHLSSVARRGDEVRLVMLALLCGLVVDGVASAQGWVVYRAATFDGLMAPPWILALWASLAVTLNTGMRALQPHLWAGALLGGIGGPLAYLAAARGWQAAEFVMPAWRGWMWLATAWALALPMLLWAARWLATRTPMR
jgi:hypothetical protein